MGAFRILLQIVIGLALSIVGFFVFKFYQLGQFDPLENINVDKCSTINIPRPCEDVVVLPDGTSFIGCDDLHDVLSSHITSGNDYIDMETRIINARTNQQGKIFTLSSNKKEFIEIPIQNYNHPDFHPHGMAAHYDAETNTNWLYVVNHRADGDFMSVFKYLKDAKDSRLEYWTSITSDIFKITNNLDIVPKTNGNFYVSNYLENDPGSWSGIAEILLQKKSSSLLFCSTPNDFFTKKPKMDIKATCKVVDDELTDANGVCLSKDGSEVFLTSGVHVRHLKRNFNDNSVTLIREINSGYAGDNVNLDLETGNIYQCVFPRPFDTVMNMLGWSGDSPVIASAVKMIDVNNNYAINTVWQTDGTTANKITACTGANKVDDKLVIVSVFDRRALICDI